MEDLKLKIVKTKKSKSELSLEEDIQSHDQFGKRNMNEPEHSSKRVRNGFQTPVQPIQQGPVPLGPEAPYPQRVVYTPVTYSYVVPPPYVRSTSSLNGYPAQQPLPSPTTPAPTSFPPKAQFMDLFSAFYDQMEETSKMTAMLRENLRKSNLLLQTLQGSGEMIEALVRRSIGDIQNEDKKDLLTAIQDLKVKVESIEKRLDVPDLPAQ